MKFRFKNVLCVYVITIITLSCTNKQNKKNKDNLGNEQKSALNLKESNYDPGAEWKLTWSDEFEEDRIDTTKWNFQVVEAGRFNEEWQRYTDSSKNAYIENNSLVIKAIHESNSHGLNQYTSARLHTAHKYNFKYGKIVARIKLPEGKGIWPAFWMLGANIDENGGDTPWPQCGEIDILELYGTKDDAVIESNLHYADSLDSHAMTGPDAYKLSQGKFSDEFHIFSLEWNTDSVTWSVDGQEFASTSILADEFSEFHKEFFLLLNLAVGGTYAGRPDDSTNFPQHMYIDWVRVYKK
jgi:beta-glucanase (GH16 family)